MKYLLSKVLFAATTLVFCAAFMAHPALGKEYGISGENEKTYTKWLNEHKADLIKLMQLLKSESNLKDASVTECIGMVYDSVYFNVINSSSFSSHKRDKNGKPCKVSKVGKVGKALSLQAALTEFKINEDSFKKIDELSRSLGIIHLHVVKREENNFCVALDPFILPTGSEDYIYFIEGTPISKNALKKDFVKLSDNWYVGAAIPQ